MSNTTEKCRDIVLRLRKAIETVDAYRYKRLPLSGSPQDKNEEKQAHNNADSSLLSCSAYNFLFRTLLELRTKSYTKNQVTRAKLIQYNIIKKIFHLLCEKPTELQAAYEKYIIKCNGRKKGEDRQVDGEKSNNEKDADDKVESSSGSHAKDDDSKEWCLHPFEVDEQQTVPFTDFRDLLLSLLGNFCLDSAARSQVIKHRGITILRSILFESESDSIWRRCCRTLANLAVDPACRKAIQATDITAKIICILESSCDSECKSTICRTLRLFAESSQLLKTIIDCNGVSILIQICRYGTQSIKVAAVKTLAELGKRNCSIEFCQQILMAEGLVKLVEMMKEDAAYSENALCILICLSHHSFIRPLMGSSDVIQTLQSKFESEIPVHLYSKILNSFCLFSNEAINRVKLRQFGILKILLNALQDQRYELLHNRIISAFVNFLYDDVSFDLLLENGLVPVLFVHLQRCAGFSFELPDTEPFVESLIEAVMNRNHGENADTHETKSCETAKECSKKSKVKCSSVDEESNTGEKSKGKEQSPTDCDKFSGDNSVMNCNHGENADAHETKSCETVKECSKKSKVKCSSVDEESNTGEKSKGKEQSPTDCDKFSSDDPVIVSNPKVSACKPEQPEALASTSTQKQHFSASTESTNENRETSSPTKNPTSLQASEQNSSVSNPIGISGLLQSPSKRQQTPKRKREPEVLPKSSKRYRLSLDVETDMQNEPAILNLELPHNHNLSLLGAETVANMLDMSASTVLSHVSKNLSSSEHLENNTTEIIAFHGSSLLEPSQPESADMETDGVDLFVSLRTKCSLNQVEEILKRKGFCIKPESETQVAIGDVDDLDDDAEDDEILENEQKRLNCIDSPSYRNNTWQTEDLASNSSFPGNEMSYNRGQYLSPLNNASYFSPDRKPTNSPQESSEESYSSEEEMQMEDSCTALCKCHADSLGDDYRMSDAKTRPPKKNATTDTAKKNSKAQDESNLANRTTEDNILILLSHISQKENPTKYLANMESFLCLLRYIGHVPLAFPRSVRILGRVVSNLFCLESLLGFMAPALIFLELMTSWNQRICEARCHSHMFWTPHRATWVNIGSAFSISSCIKGSDDLLKAGQLILNEFGVVAEINFGTCLLAQHLMKETPQQNYVIACLPFLCRSHNVQEKLLVNLRGFDRLKNIVMSNPQGCLSKVIILGLSYLACHLNIKPDPIEPTPFPKCTKSKKSLSCNLKSFPKDVTFVTGSGQKVFANKAQLTRQSDVFSAMLSSNFLECKIAEIVIPDISLVALRFIVHYLHGCSRRCSVIEYIINPKFSLPFEAVVNVLAHADQYLLTKLQNYLVKVVREKYLNYRTAGKFYNVASLHSYGDLQKECLTYCLVSLVFGSKSVSCMMDILTGPYAGKFLDSVKDTLTKHSTIDPFTKV